MTTTISNGTLTYTAKVMDGFTVKRDSRNIHTPLLGSPFKAVSSRGVAGPRSGTARLLFTSATTASQAYGLLCSGTELTLADTDVPAANFSFMTSGSIELELDDDTRALWWVSFEFEETD